MRTPKDDDITDAEELSRVFGLCLSMVILYQKAGNNVAAAHKFFHDVMTLIKQTHRVSLNTAIAVRNAHANALLHPEALAPNPVHRRAQRARKSPNVKMPTFGFQSD